MEAATVGTAREGPGAAPAPVEPVDVIVAGRHFQTCTATTFRQDMFIMALVQSAGLEELAAKFNRGEFDMDEVAQRVIVTAYTHGQLFELVGAVLVERGKKWTEAGARENAALFADLTDPADKLALRGSIVAAIVGFFVSGLLSSMTSRKSSGEGPKPEAVEWLGSDANETSAGVRATSAPGTASSAPSPGSIKTDTTGF